MIQLSPGEGAFEFHRLEDCRKNIHPAPGKERRTLGQVNDLVQRPRQENQTRG